MRPTEIVTLAGAGTRLGHRESRVALPDLLNQINLRKFATENGPTGKSEPVFQNGCIDGAEIGVELEIALVQIGQAGMFANESAFVRRRDDKHL